MPVEAPSEPSAVLKLRSWDELRAALPEPSRAILLDDLDLPPRINAFVARHGLRTLGDLADRSQAELVGERYLGRLSVHRLFVSIRGRLARAGVGLEVPPRVALPPPEALQEQEAERARAH